MEYTKKHKILIAKYLKKAGLIEDAKQILFSDDNDYRISHAIRDAAEKIRIGIGKSPALLDAVRRYETRDCAIFKECSLPRCEGAVWCTIYNLGGSHGQIGENYRHLARSAVLVPLKKRRKIMFQMLEQKTGYKFNKTKKG